jgi:hypothetical protein
LRQFVAGEPPNAPLRDAEPNGLADEESRALQKMKNSGNEAKKLLKTKDITFLDAANFARSACRLTPIRRQRELKNHVLRKTNRDFRAQGAVGTVKSRRLHSSGVTTFGASLSRGDVR